MKKYNKVNEKIWHQGGFSFLELVVVLGVVGLLTVGSISIFSEQRTHAKWQEGDTKLTLVKAALLKHAHINKFLLCPDTDADGFEDRTGGGACVANNGTVPFNNIELGEAAVQDSWGNAFLYAIDQGAVNVANITDCPDDSACFFNNTAPPAFDLTTRPVMGNPGANNLRVCNTASCEAITAGVAVESDTLIAVLVSYNENGEVGLIKAEAENNDDDQFFVQANYSEDPYYDDQIQTISANELKDRFETEIIDLQNDNSPPPANPPPNNPFAGATVNIAGGNGDNDRFSDDIGLNIQSGVLSFGAENAGETVTLTFDTVVTGGWEDADALNEGVAAEREDGKLETQDQFVVGLNANIDQRLYDVANATTPEDGRVDLQQGLDWMGNPDQAQTFYYDEDDDGDNTWHEYASYNVELDSNGDLKVDFAVFSTHVEEQVSVSHIKAVMYKTAPSTPNFPTAAPISGIPETNVFNDYIPKTRAISTPNAPTGHH